jgi:hypothetical protein
MEKMMRTEEDEAFDELSQQIAKGWRKRQIEEIEKDFDREYDNMKRNEVLEEVARELEQFYTPFGQDTINSFAAFIREMKR